MYPTILEIGWFKIHSYGLFIAIAFLLSLYLTQRDAQKRGINPEVVQNEAIFTLLAGILGSRFFHILMFPYEYSWTDPIGWIAIWQGGLVFQGALPFAFAYVVWAMRRRKISFLLISDCAVPYLALGQGIGRIGCFFNGCCYGKPSNLPCAISFPNGSPVFQSYPGNNGWSLPVHPTQLYAFFGLVFLCLLLIYLREAWNPFTGFTIPVYFFLHGLMRFINEFFRGDHNPTELGLGIFSDQQVFCFFEILLGVILFWGIRTYHKIQQTSAVTTSQKQKKKK
ncbi:MAG TPA: prolipoprotein diacylglyceryl transferase [Candidatus Hydrogenedens sp.]|nr:prolipoprotein diacylglyceryl transferase [Candidatus Hydrogenedens sp.]HOL20880.1 prolipoprotein diacylglyceryl transferase [Candidatus Hydrogenedens sp.]HPP58655.1 prolipoprotein diacylglyceryl transferase [Candidatus Hydrogenedens sp.]